MADTVSSPVDWQPMLAGFAYSYTKLHLMQRAVSCIQPPDDHAFPHPTADDQLLFFPLLLKVCSVGQSVPHRQPYGVHQGDHSPHTLQPKLRPRVHVHLQPNRDVRPMMASKTVCVSIGIAKPT